MLSIVYDRCLNRVMLRQDVVLLGCQLVIQYVGLEILIQPPTLASPKYHILKQWQKVATLKSSPYAFNLDHDTFKYTPVLLTNSLSFHKFYPFLPINIKARSKGWGWVFCDYRNELFRGKITSRLTVYLF